MTSHEVPSWDLSDDQIMWLQASGNGWANRAFAAYPPYRKGQILDWCQELIDLRDELDRVILWRAIIKAPLRPEEMTTCLGTGEVPRLTV